MWHTRDRKAYRRNHFESLAIHGRIILKWIEMKYDGKMKAGFIQLKIWQLVGYCEHGNEPSGSSICRKFGGYLRN
jgi:hypothetical protein